MPETDTFPVRPLDHAGPTGLDHTPFPAAALRQPIATRFDAICRLHRHRAAITDDTETMTYAVLHERVSRVAAALQALLGDDRQPVALLIGHDGGYPLAMLAVLASGRGYVPLDPAFPDARSRQILERSGATLLLSDRRHNDHAIRLGNAAIPVRTIEALLSASHDPAPTLHTSTSTDLAYVVYTSGTTGPPKGVFQDQAGLLHDVLQYTNAIHLRADDRLTLLYSPSVSGAIRDIFGALLNGATLHVLDPRVLGASGVAAALRDRRITIYHSIPIIFRRVMAALDVGEHLPWLRLAYLAGDRVDPDDVVLFRDHTGPDAFFHTGIGASEVATLYAHLFLSASDPIPRPRLPAGRAIPDRQVSLIDADGALVPAGEVGEISVASRYLARGYWADPGLTADRFTAGPGDTRSFRTGDLGRFRPDGALEHLGRADQQVKIRGHRIELSEIEAALCILPGVGEAALLLDAAGGSAILVAAWAPCGQAPALDEAALRLHLQHLLPPWAVPTRFVRLQSLPRLANYKLDRSALLACCRMSWPRRHVITPAGTLGRVVSILARIVDRPICPDDRLDACGIDSLLATQLLVALEHELSCRLTPCLVAADGTARRIAAHIERIGDKGTPDPLVMLKHGTGIAPTLLVIPDIEGDFRHVGRIIHALPDDLTCLGIADLSDHPDSVEEIAERAVSLIMARAPGPPISLLGYSFGGRLAYAIAARLRALGQPIGFLGLVDTPLQPPDFHPPPPSDDMDPATRRQAIRLSARALASRTYRPPPTDLTPILFRSGTRWSGPPDTLGWDALVPDIVTIPVSGDHWTMLHPQHVGALAHAIVRVCRPARRPNFVVDIRKMPVTMPAP